MKYNYVLFDNDGEYYKIARHDMEQLPNFRVRLRWLPSGSKLKKFLFRLHTSSFLNCRRPFLFQHFWCRAFVGELNFPEDKPICFIFTTALTRISRQMKLFDYLRKTYSGCKLVFLLKDTFAAAKRVDPFFDIEEAKRIYDEIYTINTIEAEQYGLKKIHSFCSTYPVETSPEDKKFDVIFVGVVKDRLDIVRRAYEKFTAAGLTCDFLLVSKTPIDGLPEGLTVQDKGIPYGEMLRRTANARCILEVTQKDSDALTSRCLEALCYNKKLISDNFRLKETKYYDSRYMWLYSDIDEIDPAFVWEEIDVDYHYDGAFSPVRGLELIESDLLRGDSEEG